MALAKLKLFFNICTHVPFYMGTRVVYSMQKITFCINIYV